jgi:hypothetical protein
MARNGSGVMSIPYPSFVANTTIQSSQVNSDFSTIVDEITNSIAADGQTTITQNIPFNSKKITGLGAGTARTDAASLATVQDGAVIWCGTAGGTADALTLSPSPAITAYAAGQVFRFKSGASANTGASTVSVSGLTAIAIQNDGSALASGDIAANKWFEVLYDGAAFQLTRNRLGGTGTGDVVGPASATSNALALFDGTTGKLLKDSTYTITAAGAALLDDANAAAQRTTLGLVIGTDVQAYDATTMKTGAYPTLVSLEGLSLASGDILYATAADTLARLPKGTDGQSLVLASGVPSWATAGGGGALEYVSSATASSSASVAFTGLASGYDYIVVADSLLPDTSNTFLRVNVGTGGTPTYQTTGYVGQSSNFIGSATGSWSAGTFNGGVYEINYNAGATTSGDGGLAFTIVNPGGATSKAMFAEYGYRHNSTGDPAQSKTMGRWDTTTAVTAIKFYYSSGNVATGNFILWRRKRSA